LPTLLSEAVLAIGIEEQEISADYPYKYAHERDELKWRVKPARNAKP